MIWCKSRLMMWYKSYRIWLHMLDPQWAETPKSKVASGTESPIIYIYIYGKRSCALQYIINLIESRLQKISKQQHYKEIIPTVMVILVMLRAMHISINKFFILLIIWNNFIFPLIKLVKIPKLAENNFAWNFNEIRFSGILYTKFRIMYFFKKGKAFLKRWCKNRLWHVRQVIAWWHFHTYLKLQACYKTYILHCKNLFQTSDVLYVSFQNVFLS